MSQRATIDASSRGSILRGGAASPPAFVHYLLLGQGLYYLIAGVWPLVSIGTFQQVTGPKTEVWLVKTVGVLVSIIGGVLAFAGLRRRAGAEVSLLAAASAVGLGAVDLVYVLQKRISPVYLLDAAAELGLFLGLVAWWRPGVRRE